MEKEYYIIGSGGFAKEVYFLAEETLEDDYSFGGFIDFEPKVKKQKVRGKEENVLDEEYFLSQVAPQDNRFLFMGVGAPELLYKLSNKFKQYNFPNLIHPGFIGDRSSIKFGRGNIITGGCVFTVDISIGSFNLFNLMTSVGHDTSIGDCNVFNPACNISGMVKIGSRNLFGVNSTVLQELEVKNDNIIGGASLANKPVESESVVVGVPAKKIK